MWAPQEERLSDSRVICSKALWECLSMDSQGPKFIQVQCQACKSVPWAFQTCLEIRTLCRVK